MCYDLNEYDPFEPFIMDYSEYEDWVYYSEQMEDYNWEEWLENDDTA